MNSELRNLWEQKRNVWEIEEWFQRLKELPQDIDHCVIIVWVRVVEYGWASRNGKLVALRMLYMKLLFKRIISSDWEAKIER
jgi:hypothetical protein